MALSAFLHYSSYIILCNQEILSQLRGLLKSITVNSAVVNHGSPLSCGYPTSRIIWHIPWLTAMIAWDACGEKLAGLVLVFAVTSPTLVLGTWGDKLLRLAGSEGVACSSDLLICLLFSLLGFTLSSTCPRFN